MAAFARLRTHQTGRAQGQSESGTNGARQLGATSSPHCTRQCFETLDMHVQTTAGETRKISVRR